MHRHVTAAAVLAVSSAPKAHMQLQWSCVYDAHTQPGIDILQGLQALTPSILIHPSAAHLLYWPAMPVYLLSVILHATAAAGTAPLCMRG